MVIAGLVRRLKKEGGMGEGLSVVLEEGEESVEVCQCVEVKGEAGTTLT